MNGELFDPTEIAELAIPNTVLVVDGTREPEVVKVIESNTEGSTPQ